MTEPLLVGLAALVVACAFMALRWQARGFARERNALLAANDRLINQLLHAVDRTWTPPPSFVPDAIPEDEDDSLIADPSQLPEV